MGKYEDGIQGPFSGKVGPVVGTSWMGMPVMRSLPRKRTAPFTPGEIQQQEKFRMMTRLLKPLSGLLNKSFESVAVKMTGYNKGYSYNLKNAFRGTHPDLTIDYSMILVGRGDLPNAVETKAISEESGQLSFSWTDNTGSGMALGSDPVYVAVYCQDTDTWIYRLNVALRNEMRYRLEVISFSGRPAHAYIGCLSANGNEASDSTYLGKIVIL